MLSAISHTQKDKRCIFSVICKIWVCAHVCESVSVWVCGVCKCMCACVSVCECVFVCSCGHVCESVCV